MPTFQELARDYARQIRAGTLGAEGLAQKIDDLVYTSDSRPLTDADKKTLVDLVYKELEGPKLDASGRRIIQDSDNSRFLALVSRVYGLLGSKGKK